MYCTVENYLLIAVFLSFKWYAHETVTVSSDITY